VYLAVLALRLRILRAFADLLHRVIQQGLAVTAQSAGSGVFVPTEALNHFLNSFQFYFVIHEDL